MHDRISRVMAAADTNGGHIFICLFVIGIGALFCSLKIPKGEDLIVAGAATLFQSMRGKGAENHDVGAPQTGVRIGSPITQESTTQRVVQESRTQLTEPGSGG